MDWMLSILLTKSPTYSLRAVIPAVRESANQGMDPCKSLIADGVVSPPLCLAWLSVCTKA
eukprot:2468494-Amphidinium_carterae.1